MVSNLQCAIACLEIACHNKCCIHVFVYCSACDQLVQQ